MKKEFVLSYKENKLNANFSTPEKIPLLGKKLREKKIIFRFTAATRKLREKNPSNTGKKLPTDIVTVKNSRGRKFPGKKHPRKKLPGKKILVRR